MPDKQVYWVTLMVVLAIGLLAGNLLRDIIPAVNRMIPYSCVYNGVRYKSGSSVPSGDRCNQCGCTNGQVTCTTMYCGDDISPETSPPTDISEEGGSVGTETMPAGVVGTTNTDDMNLRKYPDYPVSAIPTTPVTVKYIVEHRSALNTKTLTVRAVVLSSYVPEPPCKPGEGCSLGMRAPMIFLADSADPQRNTRYDIQLALALDLPQDSRTLYPVGKTVDVRATVTGDRFYVSLQSLAQKTVSQQ